MATAVLLVLGTTTAAAAPDSVTELLAGELNRQLLYVAVPIGLLVEVVLIYAVFLFRNKEAPSPTRKNRQLEITWTVATALVLLFVGTASYTVLTHPVVSATAGAESGPGGADSPPPDAVEVHVVAEQWSYTFVYPEANVTTHDRLVLPTNRSIYLYVTSRDVIHSVHVPDLWMKQDAIPGRTNLLRARLLERGTYRMYCAEFCGRDHASMRATVRVVDPTEYRTWLSERENGTAPAASTAGAARLTPRRPGSPGTDTARGSVVGRA